MIGLYIFWALSYIISYKTFKKRSANLLRKYKKDGYTTSEDNIKIKKFVCAFLSFFPFLNLICACDLYFDQRKKDFHKYEERQDEKNGLIYLATDGDFTNIDSDIKRLDSTNTRIRIKNILNFNDIKDKIKLDKILNVFKFDSNEKKELQDYIIKLEKELEEKDQTILQMKDELEYYKEERMKSVPTIQVEKEEEIEEEDKLVPIMNFSYTDDTELFETSRAKRL